MKKLKVVAAILCLSLASIMVGLFVESITKPTKEEQEKINARRYTVYQGGKIFKNLKKRYSDGQYSSFNTEDGRLIEFNGAHIKEEQKND